MTICRVRVLALSAKGALIATACSGTPAPDDGLLPFGSIATSDERRNRP
jgi:hypothetical protein